MRPKARSSSKLIISSMLALVAQRPFRTMMPWAMVASGLMLSSQTETPLFWQASGWLALVAEDGVDHRAVGVVDHAERDSWWPRA